MALNTNAPSYTYDKVVCPKCRVETDFTPADLLNRPINESIICEKCNELIISNIPKTKITTQTYVGFGIECECD